MNFSNFESDGNVFYFNWVRSTLFNIKIIKLFKYPKIQFL